MMSGLENMPKQAILVVGYYRSGTSALCGSLVDLGVRIPSDAESNEANPKGFFESTDLIKLDIRVLESMKSYWSDLSSLPDGWIDRADTQLQRVLLGELLSSQFKDAPLVGVKHPHLCRLLPLYVQALSDIGYAVKVIHTHRSPFSIATSQAKKNNMTRAHAIALWASYITSAEYLARGLPRSWVQYADLLGDANGTVHRALSEIGIDIPGKQNIEFISKALNRSAEAKVNGLYRPLARLVAEIETAIHDQPGEDVWDELREKSADLGAFIEELGRSGNRAAPGVGQGIIMSTPAGLGTTLARDARTSPVRPAERGDDVERARVLGLLEKAGHGDGKLPTISIMIAAPKGTTSAQFRTTIESIDANWHQPDIKIAFSAETQFDIGRFNLTQVRQYGSSEELRTALFSAMTDTKTDYVAILNAGDRIEPDAIARFVLRAVASGPDMIYCDEIAPSPAGRWIRAKPCMSMPRLLESCFVGDWVWYRRETVATIGGFRPDRFPGAEEQDMQIRIVAADKLAENIPEALFDRGDDTKRDEVPLETAMLSASNSIAEYLAHADVDATVRSGTLPGLFVLEYAARPNPQITLGFLCRPGVGPDIIQAMANKLMPTLDGDAHRVAFIRQEGLTEATTQFLDKVKAEVSPVHQAISVIDAAPHLAGTVVKLMQIKPDNHVAIVDPLSAPSDNDIIVQLGAMLDANGGAGVIAPLTFFRDSERTPRLRGPILFGANARIGSGYEAASPGPGGWLATTQPVDAVDGPIILIRRGVAFRPEADTWSEICATLAPVQGLTSDTNDKTLSAFWTPRRQVEIATPVAETEMDVAMTIPYRGDHHHPAMTVSGSPLLLEGRHGFVGNESSLLVTSSETPEDYKLLGAARFARQARGIVAGIAPDPVDALSLLRGRRQGRRWIRLNPQYNVHQPGTERVINADVNVWSVIPPTSLRDVVLAADRTIATSRRLGARLRGMGARNVDLQTPKLVRDVWAAFTPKYAKNRPNILWVEQFGVDVPWIDQVIRQTSDLVSWTVIAHQDRQFAGNVARKTMPIFEEDWARLFSEIGVSIMIRPTPAVDWCDDYLVRLALAGGCRVIAGNETEATAAVEPLISRTLSSDGTARWVKAVLALAEKVPDTELRDALLASPEAWLTSEDVAWLDIEPRLVGQRDAA